MLNWLLLSVSYLKDVESFSLLNFGEVSAETNKAKMSFHLYCGRHGDLMVFLTLNFSPGNGHCVVFLGKKLY